MQSLFGGQPVLLDCAGRNVAIILEPFQDGVRLALTQVPDISQFGQETLMEVIAVARPTHQEAEQGEFR